MATWDSAQWTPDELTTFIGQYMAPTFAQKYPSGEDHRPRDRQLSGLRSVHHLRCWPTRPPPAPSRSWRPMATRGPWATTPSRRRRGSSSGRPSGRRRIRRVTRPIPSMTSALVMAQRMHGDLVTTEHDRLELVGHLHHRGRPQRQHPSEPRLHPARRDQGRARTCSSAGTRSGTGPSSCAPGSSDSTLPTTPTNGVYTEAYRDATHLAIIAINTNTQHRQRRSSSSTATRSTRSRRG